MKSQQQTAPPLPGAPAKEKKMQVADLATAKRFTLMDVAAMAEDAIGRWDVENTAEARVDVDVLHEFLGDALGMWNVEDDEIVPTIVAEAKASGGTLIALSEVPAYAEEIAMERGAKTDGWPAKFIDWKAAGEALMTNECDRVTIAGFGFWWVG